MQDVFAQASIDSSADQSHENITTLPRLIISNYSWRVRRLEMLSRSLFEKRKSSIRSCRFKKKLLLHLKCSSIENLLCIFKIQFKSTSRSGNYKKYCKANDCTFNQSCNKWVSKFKFRRQCSDSTTIVYISRDPHSVVHWLLLLSKLIRVRDRQCCYEHC